MMNQPKPKFAIAPISPAAPGTLYEQIIEGIKREINAGRLHPGQPLPSFRELAADLYVSLITVKRAYEELEREGIIFRKQGLGTFVSDDGVTRSRGVKRERAESLMEEAIREGKEAGMSDAELTTLLHRTLRNTKGER